MPFVLANAIVGEYNANGIIGLAPHMHEKSYVVQLFEQGQIEEKIIGLNYEDPQDTSLESTIQFGYIDYSEIQGGEDGLNYYSNIGLDVWAV